MDRKVWKRLALLAAVLVMLVLVAQIALAQDGIVEAVAVSSTTAGTTEDGLDYDPYDVIARVTYSGTVNADAVDSAWVKLFEGEDYGLDSRHVINALAVLDEGCGVECAFGFLMSFKAQSVKVPGITPKVEGQDLVFTFAEPGPFELVFDGSDVGLTTVDEKIDGVDYLSPETMAANDVEFPFDCPQGVMFISTQGAYRVPAANGGTLVGDGSDILMFCATNFGPSTAGFWFRGHDETDHDLKPANVMSDFDINYVYLPTPNAVEDEAAFLFFSFVAHKTFTGEGGAAGGPNEVFVFPAYCDDNGYYGPVLDFSQDYPALNGKATGYDYFNNNMPLGSPDC